MKEEKYTKKDGQEGISYYPEEGDEVVADADSVFSRETLVVKDKKPLKIMNYGIQVIHNDETKFIKLTNGQRKVLDKVPDLKGKTIVFEKYTHKEWGELLGARVKK